jgi:HSP20 family protein
MMTVYRQNPRSSVLSLAEAMNRMFAEPTAAGNFRPAMDVSETETGYRLELAVPGLKAEHLEITAEQNSLVIAGKIEREASEESRRFHRVERVSGSFSRTINLPQGVNADAIVANLADGVLRIEIPKPEEVKPRRISIAAQAN